MKSTGVLRRVDELGRIVIPKEIRKNLKIRDGESLEIFINGDAVVLKKYSYMFAEKFRLRAYMNWNRIPECLKRLRKRAG